MHPDTPGGDVATVLSLTRTEARERARLVAVERYDVAVDMTDLVDGTEWRATSRIAFRCAEPGAETFVDCVGTVRSATLNGEALPPESVAGGRILLTGLAAENVLEVSSVQTELASQSGIQRSVDASDGEVYVWTTFEPDDARRVWACFDQPDLKAPHAFTVLAPATWIVRSNRPVDSVEDAEGRTDGARRWSFPDTPALSPYVTVVNAGPFHEIRVERDGWDVGLHCRRSLAPVLERDAEDLVDLTVRGLALFGESFGRPFDQRTYDTVFVPDMPGAMENWGCVTWGDFSLYRSTPTARERAYRGEILLHEMAHMWFGDLVTMQWWDDLWLNEAFASWAAAWAGDRLGPADTWASETAVSTPLALAADRTTATHPIRQPAPDVDEAAASFDAITYQKGMAVLNQLVAYVGEESFLAGLRSYFAEHAWANTTLDDLVGAVATASGRDLSGWTGAWLDRSGADLVSAERDGDCLVLTTTAPDGGSPRPHRLDVACYTDVDGRLELTATVPVEVTGPTTRVAATGDLLVLNAGNLTYAELHPDPQSLAAMVARAGELPTTMARTMVVVTAHDLLTRGLLPAADVVRCATGALTAEDDAAVAVMLLNRVRQAAELWAPADQVADLTRRVADLATTLATRPGLHDTGLRVLALTASTDEHLAVLADAVAADPGNHTLAWSVLTRRSELGEDVSEAVARLRETDPDPEAWVSALGVRAASPHPADKQAAWDASWTGDPRADVPMKVGPLFWRPGQDEVLRPYLRRYLDGLGRVEGGNLLVMARAAAFFPQHGVDESFLADVERTLSRGEALPTVRQTVLGKADTLREMLRARVA